MSNGSRKHLNDSAARGGGQRGFTLLEIAIVLLIMGLLVASLLGPIQTQREARDRRATRDTLGLAVEALYGFAILNGRLPCPDVSGDGSADPTFVETNPATADCSSDEGFLPTADLGVPAGDAWSNRLRYRVVSRDFTLPDRNGLCDGDSANEFDLCTSGSLTVSSRGDDPDTAGVQGKALVTLASGVPAVVISHGRNGYGAISVDGSPRPTPAGGTDESANADGVGDQYFARTYSGAGGGCADDTNESVPLCEFDDLVMWISPTVLAGRMVNAGRLP